MPEASKSAAFEWWYCHPDLDMWENDQTVVFATEDGRGLYHSDEECHRLAQTYSVVAMPIMHVLGKPAWIRSPCEHCTVSKPTSYKRVLERAASTDDTEALRALPLPTSRYLGRDVSISVSDAALEAARDTPGMVGDYLEPKDEGHPVSTDGGVTLPSGMLYREWHLKASQNVEKWGLQDASTLLLAMQEEQGELAQAYLEHAHEDGECERIGEELADLAALCIQLSAVLDGGEL